jgi:hypothetical protein
LVTCHCVDERDYVDLFYLPVVSFLPRNGYPAVRHVNVERIARLGAVQIASNIAAFVRFFDNDGFSLI